MDVSDSATQQEELARAESLLTRMPTLAVTGKCHNCEIRTDGLFCSIECRDDWQKRDDGRRRVGG